MMSRATSKKSSITCHHLDSRAASPKSSFVVHFPAMCAMPWSLRTVPVPVQAPAQGLPVPTPRASASRAPRQRPTPVAPVALFALPGLIGRSHRSHRSRRSQGTRCRAQVEWLKLGAAEEPSEPRSVLVEESEVVELPVMPLNAVYLPSPSQQLMISEPRYLKLFDDILVNGSRMFAVCHCRGSLLARVGLVFRLTDLKDVAQETNGHTRYVAEHEVRQRVRILSVLNPEDQESKSEYLRATVQFLEPEEDTVPEELRVILQRILKFWLILIGYLLLGLKFWVQFHSDTEGVLPATALNLSNFCHFLHVLSSGIRGKLQDALAIQGEQEQGDPEELGNQARRLRLASVIRRWVFVEIGWFWILKNENHWHHIMTSFWTFLISISTWEIMISFRQIWIWTMTVWHRNVQSSGYLRFVHVCPLQEPRLLGPVQHIGLHPIPPFATGDPSLAAAREATHRSGSVKLQRIVPLPHQIKKTYGRWRERWVCIEYEYGWIWYYDVFCQYTVHVEIWAIWNCGFAQRLRLQRLE